MTIKRSQPILIVEDSPEDYEATVRAFRKSGMANSIRRCENGEEVLDYLYRRGVYVDSEKSPRPGIILLDLNLPGMDGRDVLKIIKKDSDLKKIPTIVLTTSTDERDIEACYVNGANSYINKPVDLNGLMIAIQKLRDYWFEIVILPKEEKQAL
jgi:two-component system response regulator